MTKNHAIVHAAVVKLACVGVGSAAMMFEVKTLVAAID
jgi:hypothetical protein